MSQQDLEAIGFYSDPLPQTVSEKEVQQIQRMMDVFYKFYSHIASFSISRIEERVNHCIAKTETNSPLRGECLLKRLGYYDTLRFNGMDLNGARNSYLEWFKGFDPTDKSYARFLDGKSYAETIKL